MLKQAELTICVRCTNLYHERKIRDQMLANGLIHIQGKDKDSVEDLEEIQEAKSKLGNITEFSAVLGAQAVE